MIEANKMTEQEREKLTRQIEHETCCCEDNQKALGALANALRYTRAGSDVDRIEVVDDGCAAVIFFSGGGSKEVTIECDSAIAAFVDVCKALM